MNDQCFYAKYEGMFYFRIFGYGLWFGSYERYAQMFSERNGYQRVFRFWPGWRMKILWPNQ